ncbi:MAG TPA: glycosyltransferase, partial [Stellaceae bacterium]|nr:glycosyltransferase [Stellaceae bacterium]
DRYREAQTLVREARPDIVHVHNSFAVFSPAIYYAAREGGAALVQTMHNFRLACVNGLLWREGKVCEACLGKKVAWSGVIHGCYRGSRVASLSVASVTGIHRALGTWRREVDLYIATTEFARGKLIRAGLPPERIAVKPNFTPPQRGGNAGGPRRGALFVGRLSPEKGIELMRCAWQSLSIPLRVVGDGPIAATLAGVNPAIELLGWRDREEVAALMRSSEVLVMPSVWYETFGMVLIEAYEAGLPVIASRLGAMAELVEDGLTGFLFTPSDAESLAATLRKAFADPANLARMEAKAREVYERRYSPERGYQHLLAVYRQAMSARCGA